MNTNLKRLFVLLTIICFGVVLSACTETVATPNGFCAFVYNDGESGRDAKLVKMIRPNEAVKYTKDEQEVQFVPCGPRNYRVTDGKPKDGSGDRHTPSIGRTKTNTEVKGAWTAYWTINQGDQASKDFAELCSKYDCYTDEARAGDNNFATDGWVGMLRENFGPSGDDAFMLAIEQFDDKIWQKPTKARLNEIATKMTEEFKDQAAKRTGYASDVFCGSGSSSGWNAKNEFTCGEIRFVVDSVENASPEEQKQVNVKSAADRNKESNAAELAAAKEKYGSEKQAGFWLGVRDSIQKCKDSRVACTVVLGDKQMAGN